MLQEKLQPSSSQLTFGGDQKERLTHYLFRYPAKFHPPAVRAILERYTDVEDLVLDPFCGSGTLLVEAAVLGRKSIGTDIDPVATFVSRVKTCRFPPSSLSDQASKLLSILEPLELNAKQYETLRFTDIRQQELESSVAAESLWVPAIPNIVHWFRRYVQLDLARILKAVDIHTKGKYRTFFRLCFASIIRGCSNADPVPVSGLEVTAHMRRLDEKGRLINPYAQLRKAIKKSVAASQEFFSLTNQHLSVSVLQQDVLGLSNRLARRVDVIVTSPPYHNAVDYYRRHKLEMYWLGLTKGERDRLNLLPSYIGRSKVRRKEAQSYRTKPGSLAARWEKVIREASTERADSFRHYIGSMGAAMREFAALLGPSRRLILVLGKSSWRGMRIPTDDLIEESALRWFTTYDRLWYPVRNRYMSYSRHNQASIDEEHVLVLSRNARP